MEYYSLIQAPHRSLDFMIWLRGYWWIIQWTYSCWTAFSSHFAAHFHLHRGPSFSRSSEVLHFPVLHFPFQHFQRFSWVNLYRRPYNVKDHWIFVTFIVCIMNKDFHNAFLIDKIRCDRVRRNLLQLRYIGLQRLSMLVRWRMAGCRLLR